VVVVAPNQNQSHLASFNQEPSVQKTASDGVPSASFDRMGLLQSIVERLIDGVVLVTEQGKVLQANEFAHQICRRLDARSSSEVAATNVKRSKSKSGNSLDLQTLPQEVWRVCQALLDSDRLFPDQKVIPELEITLADRSIVRIRAQRFDWNGNSEEQMHTLSRCILVTLEDRHQALQHRAIADLLKFNLTPREGQIWQLRLQGCSYREISARLYITENTVKKHIKNILAKRQFTLNQQADAN
jgi:RNA polymerase sigma factor (sigma-70 family)